jgi:hypothetical protein
MKEVTLECGSRSALLALAVKRKGSTKATGSNPALVVTLNHLYFCHVCPPVVLVIFTDARAIMAAVTWPADSRAVLAVTWPADTWPADPEGQPRAS